MEPDVADLPHKRLSLAVNEFLEATWVALPRAAWITSHFARPQILAVPCLRDDLRNLGSLWELSIALVGERFMLSGHLQHVAERGD